VIREQRTYAGNHPISEAEVRGTALGAIENQQLLLDEYGLGHHGTRPARIGESGDSRQEVENQGSQVAHGTIVTSERNRGNAKKLGIRHAHGAGGDKFEPTVYNIDPTRAINSWKEAWESVKENTDVAVRFHDLRHTCVTRMLEGGVPLSVVASILGWSPATTARMAKRYGHIGQVALRQAVAVLDVKAKRPHGRSGSKRKGAKTKAHNTSVVPNITSTQH
jgi:hypothetical protein